MKTPVLETERLVLRPMIAADAETVFRNWTSDPAVSRFMRWACHENVEVTREWLMAEEELINSDTVYNWGFVLKESGELIGSGGLVFIEGKGMFELGYNLMQAQWGKGLATEAAAEIIEYGKTALNQTRFFCCHAKDNPASGRVMTKIGFKPTGEGVYSSWDGKRTFECREYLLEAEPQNKKADTHSPAYMPLGMCLGMSIGTAIGVAVGNLAIFMPIGLCVGLCIGALLDAENRKKQQNRGNETED